MTAALIEETRDIALCLQLRRVVFIDEQGVSEADEIDDQDAVAIHLIAWLDGKVVGTARLLICGDYGKIGRVCVLRGVRGKGIGADLIRAGVARLRRVPGLGSVKLGAQCHALGFYAGLGFEAFDPVYDDAGIDHQDMVMRL